MLKQQSKLKHAYRQLFSPSYPHGKSKWNSGPLTRIWFKEQDLSKAEMPIKSCLWSKSTSSFSWNPPTLRNTDKTPNHEKPNLLNVWTLPCGHSIYTQEDGYLFKCISNKFNLAISSLPVLSLCFCTSFPKSDVLLFLSIFQTPTMVVIWTGNSYTQQQFTNLLTF